jgi:hypothetical protein
LCIKPFRVLVKHAGPTLIVQEKQQYMSCRVFCTGPQILRCSKPLVVLKGYGKGSQNVQVAESREILARAHATRSD